MQNWTIKDISKLLEVTPQAIYKQKKDLIKKGYMIHEGNSFVITLEGYNYLTSNKKVISETNKESETPTPKKSEETTIQILNKEIERLTKEREEMKRDLQEQLERERTRAEYFKNLFERKDLQITQYLLASGTEQAERNQRKSFFERLFNK